MGPSPAALTSGGAQTAQDSGLPEAGLGHPPPPPPALPLASPVSSVAHKPTHPILNNGSWETTTWCQILRDGFRIPESC